MEFKLQLALALSPPKSKLKLELHTRPPILRSLAVVANGVDGAGLESFATESFLLVGFRLLEHVGMLLRSISHEVLGRNVAADITVYALAVDVVWARFVIVKL